MITKKINEEFFIEIVKKCHSEPSIKRELKLGLLRKVSASTAKVQLQVRKQRLSDLTDIVGTVLFF